MRIITIVLITLISATVSGQEIIYNFNNCGLAEANGDFPDATTTSLPECVCGIVENGFYFDGNQDHLIFDEGIDSLLEEDFTISFYFRIDQATRNTDIFSIKSDCLFDSLLSVTYQPLNNQIFFQIGTSIGTLGSFEEPIDPSLCWHRFVLTKASLVYTWYLDGKLIDTYVAPTTVAYGAAARMAFANSPCVGTSEDRFNGWLDEFTIHRRALSSIEITDNDLQADRIITQDTTIVLGETVDIFTGPTCATSFTWTPTNSILNPSLIDITVDPDITTEYMLELVYPDGCITEDNVTVFVISNSDLDCNNLLLPNAFTPNGDQLNDLYGISNLFLVDDIEYFEIYDRWGAKVWETNDKAGKWDGLFGGSKVNPGMFIYKIKYICQGAEYIKLDNFSVLR